MKSNVVRAQWHLAETENPSSHYKIYKSSICIDGKSVFSYICIGKLAYKYDGPHRNILTKLSIDILLLDKMFIAIFSENINKLPKIYKLTLYLFCLNGEC